MNQSSKSPKIIFVTGTDTDAGKTVVATALLYSLAGAGYTTAALKPIAAGADVTEQGLRNDDALQLQAAATLAHDYQDVNPILFTDPIAPHIAALNEGVALSVESCVEQCQTVIQSDVDAVVVEGAGGWLVPLNDLSSMADLASALKAEVILVVGIKLGCINHALLTVEAIENSGLKLLGWIANHLHGEIPESAANIASLGSRINAPLLAEMPYIEAVQSSALSAEYIDVSLLKSYLD